MGVSNHSSVQINSATGLYMYYNDSSCGVSRYTTDIASSPVFPLFRDCLIWFKDIINEMSAQWSRHSRKPGKDHHATDVRG